MVIALASILYGSVMAFTQTNVRLIAGFSSVAQLGFITLGIFSLRADGADGAVLQMVNHGLVVAPVFIIAALLAERAGTEDIREDGRHGDERADPRGAVPRSSRSRCSRCRARRTSSGSSSSSTASSRRRSRWPSSPRSGSRSPPTTRSASTSERCTGACPRGSSRARSRCPRRSSSCRWSVHRRARAAPGPHPRGAARPPSSRRLEPGHGGGVAMSFTAPEIDYAGISPLIALTAGLCVVLLSGVITENRWTPTLLSLATLGAAAGLCIWQWGENQDLVAGALRLDDLGARRVADRDRVGGVRRPDDAARARRRARRARRLPGAAARLGAGDGDPGDVAEPDHALRRARAALGPALRPLRLGALAPRVARVRAQVPDRRLAGLGDAALRARVHLRRVRLDRLHRHPRRASAGALRRPAPPGRDRRSRRPGSRSRSRWRRFTSGRPTSTRARRPR